jgi:TPR repeat protein
MRYLLITLLVSLSLSAGDLELGMSAAQNGDFQKAYSYFKQAAESGNVIAQQNLAVMINNGYGVQKDKNAAAKLFKAEVAQNNYNAI